MRNWWAKIGCLLTGWNPSILGSCTESSRKQLKKYSSAILILIILWAFIGYSFADRYVQAPWWGCVLTAIIFVTIIIQIERQIILTVGKNRYLAIFRLVIALIMAIIGSVILDQIIFKKDIEKKMIEIVDRQVNEQLPIRLTTINTKLQALKFEIDSIDRNNLKLYEEISKRPTISTISSSTTYLKVLQSDGSFKTEPQYTYSNSPITNPKVREAEINNQHLEILREQQEVYTQKKLEAESILRDELKSKQGFLEELNAIIEILSERKTALFFYLILFFFLMSLELFVITSKLGDKSCDYDLVIEHQLEQKKRTLSELVK